MLFCILKFTSILVGYLSCDAILHQIAPALSFIKYLTVYNYIKFFY
jgi:hypothetical protein